MLVSIGELRALIAEASSALPPRLDVEAMLQSARYDAASGSRALSLLDRRAPRSSKLLIGALKQALDRWITGRAGWSIVVAALDRLYGAGRPSRRSYAGNDR